MRVVFAGTPAFAIPSLAALLRADFVDVVGVYTAPDKPAGRGRKVRRSAIKDFALTHDLQVFQPESLHESEALQRLQPDLVIVVAYGLLLPPKMLAIPKLGCVNLHASLLPRWRGAAPIQRAIEAGDSQTGVTLMQMSRGLDCGAMLARATMAINDDDTAGTLHDKLAQRAGELLAANLSALADGELSAQKQNENDACYAKKITTTEADLDWRQDAQSLARKVRAFNPSPLMRAQFADGKLLKVLTAYADSAAVDARPGEIVGVDKNGIKVATGDGVLTLTEIQKPGGKAMSVAALLNGMDIKVGMTFAAA